MTSISAPLIFLFLSLAGHTFATPNPLYYYCPNSTFFPASNTTLRWSRDTLLYNLSAAANSSSTPGFYNATVEGTIYGLYLCRGDVDPATCRECVAVAAADLSQTCPRGKQAATWYDQCMIRYSNSSFFGQVDEGFHLLMWNTQNVTGNVTGFNQALAATLGKVTTGAARGGSAVKFDTEENKFNDFQSVYTLGQCTPDLSSSDCYQCLQQCIANLPGDNRQGGRVLYFSCNLRYEIYLFYTKMNSATPTLLRTDCPSTEADVGGFYGSNIKSLLSTLNSSAAANNQSGFYNDTVGRSTPTAVYGLYLCRGDITSARCRDCVATASANLAANCSHSKQAVALYEECTIRYSNKSFFGHLYPDYLLYTSKTQNRNIKIANFDYGVGFARGKASEAVKYEAATSDGKMFATDNESISNTGYKVYMLGQCTPDLSSDNCKQCLERCINALETCCQNRQGAGVYYFNCNLRYELYQFYDNQAQDVTTQAVPSKDSPAAPSPTTPTRTPPKPNSSHTLLIIIGSVIAGTVVMFLCLALWKRKFNMASKADLSDFVAADSLKMDFNTIRAATQNFAIHRKLGQGGFGSVYKGTLENGEDIAVKRLSETSGQGTVEFTNEVLLDAQLKHRNLVKLLGFCVSRKERILVYEYLPNSSFDKILFDPTKRMSLNWETRFKIICGIAKGLMYLHEDSRQRVVHRDLKPSNILLDEDMNPKISDFGLAKLFTVDQTQDVTDSIAGTYGYMAPEYILMGHYSTKSDVYSFGIIVLEVVSGQRNQYTNRQLLEEALLYRAWKLWNEGEAQKLMDENLGGNYAKVDAIKCIHIGLLCIQESVAKRPSMTSIVAALGGQSITLPSPLPPNFFRNNNPNYTSTSGVGSGQGVSMGQTSELTELHAR